MTKSLLLSIAIIFSVVFSAFGQKYAYLNSTQLLLELPQVKAADSELEAYQKGLIAKGESMVKSFEADYNKYAQDAQGGTLTGIQSQQREADLAQKQQNIQNYEVEVKNLIAQKREVLYKPILDKVKVIVEQVGKENGYSMVFDASVGGILFAVEADNIMSQVKLKLGL